MLKKILIIFVPAILLVCVTWLFDYFFYTGDIGGVGLYAIMAGAFWIGLSTFVFAIREALKKKQFGYLWYSIFVVASYLILSMIGYGQFLFYVLISYFVG